MLSKTRAGSEVCDSPVIFKHSPDYVTMKILVHFKLYYFMISSCNAQGPFQLSKSYLL